MGALQSTAASFPVKTVAGFRALVPDDPATAQPFGSGALISWGPGRFVNRAIGISLDELDEASLDELEARGTIDRAMHSLFAASMVAGMRLIISGETGAGKTTLVRALINTLPEDTRVVVIEDTRELNLGADPGRTHAVLEWETREANLEGVGAIAQRELVRHALRFNPQWLIVSEVRCLRCSGARSHRRGVAVTRV